MKAHLVGGVEVQGGEIPVLQVEWIFSQFRLHLHFSLLLVEQEHISEQNHLSNGASSKKFLMETRRGAFFVTLFWKHLV